MKKKDSFFVPLIIVLSILIPIAVALLMIFPDVLHVESERFDFRSLPFFHAILNGCTAILIFAGFILIKNKNTRFHKISMMTAFVLSSVFLISYVISKLTNDPIPFGGEGVIRYIYFFVLISHIVLSVPASTVGNGFTVTRTESVDSQLLLSVTVTVYIVVVIGLAIGLATVVELNPVPGLHT